MIHYALKCDAGHHFESWFQSAAAFDALEKSGHLNCTQCGCNKVRKAVMAPRVATTDVQPEPERPLSSPNSEAEHALAQLRKHVEENADYVGGRFADEARSIYLGSAPERPIYGEANGAEARALIEDGVPVTPLPFIPNRKSN
jgi:hypothetical protein